jgi:biotin carboxyl carrier protein
LTFNFPSSIKAACYLREQTDHHIKGREERMSTEIVAPMPGTIINILVNVGDEVLEYQEVLILEAMKMENAIPSTEAGTVKEIKVNVNDKVATNQVLMVLE